VAELTEKLDIKNR
jgi:dynein heavy chain, axonemal